MKVSSEASDCFPPAPRIPKAMFDPDSYISDSVVLRHEGTVALQSEGGTTGTVFAIPNAKDTIRYFEIHVELNRGGIFVGFATNAVTKSFPHINNLSRGLGNHPETWALDSYTGSIGSAGTWKKYGGRKIKMGDCIGCILDLKRGAISFILDERTPIVEAFTGLDVSKTYFAGVTIKYKNTKIRANFSSAFQYQNKLEAHLAANSLPACLPLCATHPSQLEAEVKVSDQAVEWNRASSPFYCLPEEVVVAILRFSSAQDLSSAMRTCRLFRAVGSEESLWADLLWHNFRKIGEGKSEAAKEAPPHQYQLLNSANFHKYRVLYSWRRGRYGSKANFWTGSKVNSLQFDSRYLICGTDDDIVLFDMKTGARMEPTLPMMDEVLQIAFDQTRLFAADSAGRLTVFDLETGHVETRIDAHMKEIEAMSLIPNTPTLLTGSWNRNIKLWDILTETAVETIATAHDKAVSVVKWLDNSGQVFVSAGYEGVVKFWDSRLGLNNPVFKIERLHKGAVSALSVSDNLSQIVTGGADASIKLTEVRYYKDPSNSTHDNMWLQQYLGHNNTITGIHFEKGGRLVSCSADANLRIWDQSNSKCLSSIHSVKMTCLQCDDERVIVGTEANRAVSYSFGNTESEYLQNRRKYFMSRCQ